MSEENKELNANELLIIQKEKQRKKEQREQKKEIRDIMKRIGFPRLLGIDGKEFVYDGRTSELDDLFVCENVIVLTEYTVGEPHLLKKSVLYNKINSNIGDFIRFLVDNKMNDSFSNEFNDRIKPKYTVNQLILRILYCSKKGNMSAIKRFSFFICKITKEYLYIITNLHLLSFYLFI